MTNIQQTGIPSQTPDVMKTDAHVKCRGELKKLRRELTEVQGTNTRLSVKNGVLRQRVATSRSQELALRQYNRMLLEMIKHYMDQEATLLANTRTVLQAYPREDQTSRTQATIHEVFDE